jgi:hypothetical protein
MTEVGLHKLETPVLVTEHTLVLMLIEQVSFIAVFTCLLSTVNTLDMFLGLGAAHVAVLKAHFRFRAHGGFDRKVLDNQKLETYNRESKKTTMKCLLLKKSILLAHDSL